MSRPRLLMLDEPGMGLALQAAQRGYVMERGAITLPDAAGKLLAVMQCSAISGKLAGIFADI